MAQRALFYRRPSEPQVLEIVVDAAVHLVRLRRHARARRYLLSIQTATREVLLTIPLRGSLEQARAFAEKHRGWIAARLNRLPDAAPFVDGAALPLRGRAHQIVQRRGMRGTVWTEAVEGEMLLCVAGEAPHLARRVADFLKREAKRDLEHASRRYADQLGVAIARVSVRDQTSRWGSCSTNGVLSFSWRLILAPPHVLDYLVAHEVAHLVEMNHSRKFWRMVQTMCPDANRAKVWLDAHGADLHRYGARSFSPPAVVGSTH